MASLTVTFMILALVAACGFAVGDDGNEIVHSVRRKRDALIFPPASVLQLTIGVSAALDLLGNPLGQLNYAFQQNVFLPTNYTELLFPPTFKAKRSLRVQHIVQQFYGRYDFRCIHKMQTCKRYRNFLQSRPGFCPSTITCHLREKIKDYEIIAVVPDRRFMANGTECLKKVVCQVAETPLQGGLLEEILNFVFNPSNLQDLFGRESERHPFATLESIGKYSGDCHSAFPGCPRSPLESISRLGGECL